MLLAPVLHCPFVFCQTALINMFIICRRKLCRVLKLGNVIEEKI